MCVCACIIVCLQWMLNSIHSLREGASTLKTLRLLFFSPSIFYIPFWLKASFCKHSQLNPPAVPWGLYLIDEALCGILRRAESITLGVRRLGAGIFSLFLLLLITQHPSSFNVLSQKANLGWIPYVLVDVWIQMIIFIVIIFSFLKNQGLMGSIFRFPKFW